MTEAQYAASISTNKRALTYKSLSSRWIFRLVRWTYGAIFIAIGFLYEDAWAAHIFGGLFIITSFLKPVGCVGKNCSIEKMTDVRTC